MKREVSLLNMWRTIIMAAAGLGALMFIYTVLRARRLGFIRRIAEDHKVLAWFAAAAVPAVFVLPFLAVNIYASVIALLHLAFIWLICDIADFIVCKVRRAPKGKYIAGCAAMVITAAVLALAWANAHNVRRTYYSIQTDPEGHLTRTVSGPFRAVLIADSHIGITLDGEDFAREMERVQAEEPDAVFICGDFVDDDTAKEDMLAACEALGRLKTTCGVFYIYGNHDNGYYRTRSFSAKELRQALIENGVVILEDEAAELSCGIVVIGRKDRSSGGRMNAEYLMNEYSDGRFTIMLDHQPNDTFSETVSHADLVLCGHTHGGHIFPAGQIGLIIGANDLIYGKRVMGASDGHTTTFIVTSGISGWAIPFKTGCFSEYVVIDILAPDANN